MSNKFMIGVLRLILAAWWATLIFGCNTTKKSTNSHSETKDSSRVVNTDIAAVHKKDSSHVISTTVVIITDTGSKTITEIIIEPDTNYHSDYPARESDYYYQDTTTRKIRIKGVDVDLGKIKPKKITFRETKTNWIRDSANIKIFDSTGLVSNDSTGLKKTDSSRSTVTISDNNKTNNRYRIPVLLQVFIILIVLILIFLFIIFLRKKK